MPRAEPVRPPRRTLRAFATAGRGASRGSDDRLMAGSAVIACVALLVLPGVALLPGAGAAPSPALGGATAAGANWSRLSKTSAPGPLEWPAMAYDVHDSYVLMFGGYGASTSTGVPIAQNVTWSFAAGTWTKITTNRSPPVRYDAMLAFDPSLGSVVLFGGLVTKPKTTVYYNDTWTYRAGAWTPFGGSTAPPPRAGGILTYDESDGYLVLFGGYTTTPTGYPVLLNDTWVLFHGVWKNISRAFAPPRLANLGGGYDVRSHAVVVHGGWRNPTAGLMESNRSWKFVHGLWSHLWSPGHLPALANLAMTYDRGTKSMILFGGVGGYSVLTMRCSNDTWSYASGRWSNVSYSPSPAPREAAAMAYDRADGYLVLYGGIDLSVYYPSIDQDTWIYR